MRAALVLVLLAAGCGAPRPPTPTPTPSPVLAPRDLDREACAELCAKESGCPGTDAKTCAATCDADRRRMKPGFVRAYVTCFAPRLVCGDEKAREKVHLECFDVALAGFPRDDRNQRDMAEPVCDRGERCMGLGKLGRDACLQATLNPQESEIRLGQRVVDALGPERVRAFRACVDGAPCAKPDTSDDTVDRCYTKTIVEGT